MKYCRARPYEGTQPYIFFSYNHDNADRVYPVIERMAQDGIRVWYDDGLRPGDDWPEVIAEHLDKAAAMVVAVSREYAVSHNCCNELTVAVDDNKPVISIVLDEFVQSLGMRMQLIRCFNLKKYEFPDDKAFYDKLLTASVFDECRGAPIPLVDIPVMTANEEKQPASGTDDLLKLLLGSEEVRKLLGLTGSSVKHPVAEPVVAKPAPAPPVAEPVVAEPVPAPPVAEPVVAEPVPAPSVAEPVVAEPVPAPPATEPVVAEPVPASSATEPVAEDPVLSVSELSPKQDDGSDCIDEDFSEGTVIDRNGSEWVDCTIIDGVNDLSDDGDATVIAAPKILPSVLLVPEKGKAFEVNKTEMFVGRDGRKSQIAFPEERVLSRRHVKIMWLEGKPYVSDCESLNGTILDQEALVPNKPVQLRNLSVLRLYELKMIFVMGSDAKKIIDDGKARMLVGLGDTEDILLQGPELHIHRSREKRPGNVSDVKVSRNHAKLTVRDDKLFVTDIGSSNGTYINGRRLELHRDYPMEPGMELQLGTGTTAYRYVELKMK